VVNLNIFARRRLDQEEEVKRLKQRQDEKYKQARRSIKEVSDFFANGIAVKIYKATHERK
jgi:hypothetical protein